MTVQVAISRLLEGDTFALSRLMNPSEIGRCYTKVGVEIPRGREAKDR
jgi:hypothetical protein